MAKRKQTNLWELSRRTEDSKCGRWVVGAVNQFDGSIYSFAAYTDRRAAEWHASEIRNPHRDVKVYDRNALVARLSLPSEVFGGEF